MSRLETPTETKERPFIPVGGYNRDKRLRGPFVPVGDTNRDKKPPLFVPVGVSNRDKSLFTD